MNICFSGGALGADIAWGNAAKSHGHEVIHWSFHGHKSKAAYGIYELNLNELAKADQWLALANHSLKRSWPIRNEHVANLLRRNYWQICESESVYAVSSFVNDDSLLKINGGTSWALQLYVDRCSNEHIVPYLYMFDQTTNSWYQWNKNWKQIIKPPIPSGIYTGIGTRDLSLSGLTAIQEVYS